MKICNGEYKQQEHPSNLYQYIVHKKIHKKNACSQHQMQKDALAN